MNLREASTLERRQVPLQLREVSKEGEFCGYASVFDVKDSYDTIMVKGCFERTLDEHKERGSTPKLLYQHNSSQIIGEHTTLREDDTGLYIEGRLYHKEKSIPEAGRAHTLMRKGQLDGISIGFSLYEDGGYEYSSEADAFLIRELNLWENSIVTFASNPDAKVSDVRSAFARGDVPSPSALEKAVRQATGMSEREAKILISGGYKQLKGAHLEARGTDTEALEELTRALNSMAST